MGLSICLSGLSEPGTRPRRPFTSASAYGKTGPLPGTSCMLCEDFALTRDLVSSRQHGFQHRRSIRTTTTWKRQCVEISKFNTDLLDSAGVFFSADVADCQFTRRLGLHKSLQAGRGSAAAFASGVFPAGAACERGRAAVSALPSIRWTTEAGRDGPQRTSAAVPLLLRSRTSCSARVARPKDTARCA